MMRKHTRDGQPVQLYAPSAALTGPQIFPYPLSHFRQVLLELIEAFIPAASVTVARLH